MAEKWIKEARNDAKNEVHLRIEAEKSLGVAKQECKELASKLIVEERERRNAEAGLKNAQDQAEDQCKLLYQIEIELATQRQLVLELKAVLQKAKEVAQEEKEAAKASKQESYLLDVEETQIRLVKELVEICRDYCKITWEEALNLIGVPTNSEWRQPGSVYYHPEIRKVPTTIPPPSALAPESSRQPLTTQVTLPFPEVSKGSSQAGDQGQEVEVAKDKGKGKETKPPQRPKMLPSLRKLQSRQRRRRPRLKRLILRPWALLSPSRARKKTLLQQRPRLST